MAMETEDLMKYALIGVGGYLIYRWAVESGYLGAGAGGGGGQITDGNGAGAGAGNGAGSGAGSGAGDGGSGAGTGNGTDAGAGNGSGNGGNASTDPTFWGDFVSRAGQGPKQFWAWNFYLPADTPKPDPFQIPASAWQQTSMGQKPTSVPQIENFPLTYEEYRTLVGAVGLSGVIRPSFWAGENQTWIQ